MFLKRSSAAGPRSTFIQGIAPSQEARSARTFCSDPGKLRSRGGRFLAGVTRTLDAVNASLILNGNQFQIVRRNGFPFRVLHFESRGLSGAFVQNLKTFLAAGEEVAFSPLSQSNDHREQVSAFLG